MPFDLETLKQRLIDINEESQNIVQAALADERELTDDENMKLEALDTEYNKVDRQIRNIERVQDQAAALTRSPGRQTDPDDDVMNRGDRSQQSRRFEFVETPEMRRNNGFRSFGEFAMAVRSSVRGNIDPRLLRNAPTTVSTEGTGADGGFLVPPDYRTAIMEKVMGEDSLLGRTDTMETASNTLVIPADETTPWQSSGGLQAYWESENGQITQSKVQLKEKTVRLNKLTALVPVTEELLADASGLDTYLRRKVPEKFDFKINNALINGTGAGEPKGILNADGLVSVAKESGQSADTIVFENIVNMWSRMYAPLRRNAVWLINQEIEPQLYTLSFEGTSSSVPAYMPANGLSTSPFATLMGRPVVPTQACKALGDVGDIIFAAWDQYLTAVKSTGIRQDVSIHLWFDYDTAAYRFIMRVGGQPWWASTITGYQSGVSTLGAFIALAARA